MENIINQNLKWYNILCQLIHLGLGGILMIILWIILGRYWSVELFGYFNYLFAYISIVGIFFDFGLDILVIRLLSKKESKSIPDNCWKLKRIVFLVVLIVSGIIGYLLDFPIDSLVFLILGIFLLSFTSYFNAFFRAREHLHIEAKIGLFQKTFFIGLSLFGIISFQQGIFFIAIAYFSSHLLALLITVFILYKKHWLLFCYESLPTIDYWHQSWPLFITALLAVLAIRVDIFLLQWMGNAEEVGFFSAVIRLFEGASIISSAFIAVVFPKFVEKSENIVELFQYFSYTRKILIILAFIIVVPGLLLAPFAITTLYGAKFSPSILLLQALLPLLVVVFMTTLSGNLLIAIGKQQQYMKILAIILVIQIMTNLVTIHLWGAMGAVIGYWIRELVLFIALVWFLKMVRTE